MAWWHRRPAVRRRAVAASLPELLDEVARSLRSGASLHQALDEAAITVGGPTGASVRRLVSDTARGATLAHALVAWAGRDVMPEVTFAATALGLASSSGGQAAQAVDAVAATLRERRAVGREVRAQSVQARLSAVVIALLPVVFTTWCAVSDPRIASFLFATAPGWACLVGGAGLLGAGGAWMARIVRSAA